MRIMLRMRKIFPPDNAADFLSKHIKPPQYVGVKIFHEINNTRRIKEGLSQNLNTSLEINNKAIPTRFTYTNILTIGQPIELIIASPHQMVFWLQNPKIITFVSKNPTQKVSNEKIRNLSAPLLYIFINSSYRVTG
jgi:hypothetical protein